MSDIEKRFQEYDWHSSEQWKTWFDNLYPTPPASKVTRFKRKFFKTNVDNSLPIDPPPEPIPNTRQTTMPRTPPQNNVAQKVWAPVAEAVLAVAVILTLAYVAPTNMQSRFRTAAIIMYIGGFMAALITDLGLPQLDSQYWKLAVYNPYAQAVMLVIPSSIFKNVMGLMSPAITAVAFIASRRSFSHPILRRMHTNKPYLEIFVGFLAIVTILTGQTSIIGAALYWNTLRMLYQVAPSTKRAFADLNAFISLVVPRVIYPYYLKISDFIWRYSEPSLNY